MISPSLLALAIVLALLAGAALGQYWRASWIRRNQKRLRKQARDIIREAERVGKSQIAEAELQIQELTVKKKSELDIYSESVKSDLNHREERLFERAEELRRRESDFEVRRELVASQQAAVDKLKAECQSKLAEIAGMNEEDAKQKLFSNIKSSLKSAMEALAHKIYTETVSQSKSKAMSILATTMERMVRDYVKEKSVVLIPVASDDMRGRLIGRDGRNIRAIESLAGVELSFEEIPDNLMISSHNPERREIAKVAILALVEDGRIQPTRIKEFISLAQAEVGIRNVEVAKEAFFELDLPIPGEEVLTRLGALRFRTSQGQNVFNHLLECGHLALLISAELGLSEVDSRRLCQAALLHDIGKGLGEDFKGSHAMAGSRFLEPFGFDSEVLNAIEAHHGEVADSSLIAPLLRVVDAISGSRPAARREQDNYFQRLEDIEQLAKAHRGVVQAYALQAGRELQVLVSSDEVSETEIIVLAEEIGKQIKEARKAPGEMEITVIRETRVSQIV